MSFTIKCDKCGSERTFTSESENLGENVSINVYASGSYSGDIIKTIDIDCENPNCNNDISLNY